MDEGGGEPDHLSLIVSDVPERFDAEAQFEATLRANSALVIGVSLRGGRRPRQSRILEA